MSKYQGGLFWFCLQIIAVQLRVQTGAFQHGFPPRVFILFFKNRIRQNLREKHVRHIADLRAYYDSEMQSLKQQLEASRKPSEDLKKMNQSLADR